MALLFFIILLFRLGAAEGLELRVVRFVAVDGGGVMPTLSRRLIEKNGECHKQNFHGSHICSSN